MPPTLLIFFFFNFFNLDIYLYHLFCPENVFLVFLIFFFFSFFAYTSASLLVTHQSKHFRFSTSLIFIMILNITIFLSIFFVFLRAYSSCHNHCKFSYQINWINPNMLANYTFFNSCVHIIFRSFVVKIDFFFLPVHAFIDWKKKLIFILASICFSQKYTFFMLLSSFFF